MQAFGQAFNVGAAGQRVRGRQEQTECVLRRCAARDFGRPDGLFLFFIGEQALRGGRRKRQGQVDVLHRRIAAVGPGNLRWEALLRRRQRDGLLPRCRRRPRRLETQRRAD